MCNVCPLREVGNYMGVHPKIGITGLPRSGKTAVLSKVLEMLQEERVREINSRGGDASKIELIGGMKTEPIVDGSERVGFEVVDIKTGDRATMAHKNINSRLRVLGYGIDTEALESIAIPAIDFAKNHCEVMVIDEIGKFAVESEFFVKEVRSALEIDKPTLLALHKKSRHPLLQDIRRRDDARILEVTPVNRALLPYKIHKLMRETY